MQQPRTYRCQVIREDTLIVVPQQDGNVQFIAVEKPLSAGIFLSPRALRNLIEYLEPMAAPAAETMQEWFDGAAGR